MTEQRTLFDLPNVDTLRVAETARDEAIARAAATAETWLSSSLVAIEALAREQFLITTDDVWERVDPTPEPRAMGAAMTYASRRGYIAATEQWQKSTRVECHARHIRVWRSLRFGRDI